MSDQANEPGTPDIPEPSQTTGIRSEALQRQRRTAITVGLCLLAAGGIVWGVVALTATGDPAADDTTSPNAAPESTQPVPTTSGSSVQTTDPHGSTSSAAMLPPTTTAVPSTNPAPTVPPTSTAVIPIDEGRTLTLALNAASGFVSASDGVDAYVWALADGEGLALAPSGLETRKIAAIPAEVLSSACNGDEMVWTGTDVFFATTTAFALYHPQSDSWTSGQLPAPRYCGRKRLAVLAGSRVAVLGGSTAPLEDPNSTAQLTVEFFDPTTQVWFSSSPAPAERRNETSAAFAHGLLLVAGDGDSLTETWPFLVYDIGTDTWGELPPPGPLTYTPYITTYNDRILAIGLDNRASALTDPMSPEWQAFPPSTPSDVGRHPIAFVTMGPRLVYLHTGGQTSVSIFDGTRWYESNDLDLPVSWNNQSVTAASGFVVVAGASTANPATSSAIAFVVPVDDLVEHVIGD